MGIKLSKQRSHKGIWCLIIFLGIAGSVGTGIQQDRERRAHAGEIKSLKTSIDGLKGQNDKMVSQIENQRYLSKEELALNCAPMINLVHVNNQFQVWNRGKTVIMLWGNKYGDMAPDMNDPPVSITPQDYSYYATDNTKELILSHLGNNGEAWVPLEIFISTANNQKYVVHYRLWEIVKDGQITIHTQNNGLEKKDWSKVRHGCQQVP